MKLLILLCLLFGYLKADDDIDCDQVECGDGVCTTECADAGCGEDGAGGCVELPSETLEAVDCDDDQDENNWTVEYIGSSTQWRIIDPCDGRKITFKMEDLTEYESNGKKTVNKETSFASIKGWDPDTENFQTDNGWITNTFDAQLKNGATFKLVTQFARTEVTIQDPDEPDDVNATITVDKNNFKFTVDIDGWNTGTDTGNYLELCVSIKTNSKGTFEGDGKVVENGEYYIENPEYASCGDDNELSVTPQMDANGGNNQLRICYTFAECNDGKLIHYDPLVKILSGGNTVSVFVVCIVSIMSLFFV